MKYFSLAFLIGICMSCGHPNSNDLAVRYWIGKTIVYPDSIKERLVDNDKNAEFRILSYIDSLGCISCKLQLNKWKKMQSEMDTTLSLSTSIVFIVHPSVEKDIRILFKAYQFSPSLCIFDKNNEIYLKNKFPSQNDLQTFLVNKNNEILAIGNPVHNPKVKELYLKIIAGKELASSFNSKERTQIMFDTSVVDLEAFDWKQEQVAEFAITNTGKSPLVIQDVITSCGCTTVEYPNEPVLPSKNIVLKVKYKAEHPEHFNKTITVYCNAENAPLKLRITGNAE